MIYSFVFIFLLVLELGYFKLANKLNIIDKPNERSSHTRITLRGGGIVFVAGALLYFFLFGLSYPWFFAGLVLIAGISFADDIKPRSSKVRLLVQLVAMLLMFHQWGLFELPWYFTPVALVFCLGVLNAYNFMDGINGITGGYSLVVMGALWYINSYQVEFVDNNLIYLLLIALLIFNFFNFRTKAVCFAGDVGAISMAFILVFLLGLLIFRTGNFSYIMLLGIYGVDAILTIVHRLMLRENIFKPHRKHLYQLMANELKIPHVVVSFVYMLLQALVSTGLLLTTYSYEFALSMLTLFSIVYIVFMKKYYRLHTC